MTVELPNIRKLFLPDPGYRIFEADLSGADAQVVAWEADDADLKAAFRSGLDVHDKNATDLLGEAYTSLPGDPSDSNFDSTPKGRMRKKNKAAVHATNYGASARTVAITQGWPISQGEAFQASWFAKHPGIKQWHRTTEYDLRLHRRTTNRFGYRIIWFDRIDGLLPQALAWGPQSTVAFVTFKGAVQLEKQCPWVEILLQVHDSLLVQAEIAKVEEVAEELKACLDIPVEIKGRILRIPVDVEVGENWEEMRKL